MPSTENGGAPSIGVFYGTSTGNTEEIAFDICDAWAEAGLGELEAVNIADVDDLSTLEEFDCLIVGCPTWDIGELQEDWEDKFPKISKLDLSGKKVAVFGAGDQEGYPDNFQDAIGILGKEFRKQGATLVGFTSTDGYEFDESAGVEGDQFMGLSLDEDNQAELSAKRVRDWVQQLGVEFGLSSS